VLEAAGAGWSDVLRVECFLADAGDLAAWNEAWCGGSAAEAGADDARRRVRHDQHPDRLQATARVPGAVA
jgi:enamine deaminase RidA (YjgF/YER057c/UK114 family)